MLSRNGTRRFTVYSVGDKVRCQFYNSVEGVYYGEIWESEIVAIHPGAVKRYEVLLKGYPNRLSKKEITHV